MSESYILHDIMRKVKADGLFDSIRRDLISDIEQKPSYLDLKSKIESLMSSYLAEHQWSPTLKKSDVRERARRHIETSNLIKDSLPTIVNQYMQTCEEHLIQARLSSFIKDHIEHVYNSIGNTHVYHPPTSYTPLNPTTQEISNQAKPSPVKTPITPELNKPKTKPVSNQNLKPSDVIKKTTVPSKDKMLPAKPNPIREQKKLPQITPPIHSPDELVDISPSPPSTHENEQTAMSSSPSPPPPIVCVAPPLPISSNNETPRKMKRSNENNNDNQSIIEDVKKKKTHTDEKCITDETVSTQNESDTRKLRPRRPNPKYLNEQYETEDLNLLKPQSPPPSSTTTSATITKSKKTRQLKPSLSLEQADTLADTPLSPPQNTASAETVSAISNMSPEYGTSLPSPTIDKQSEELNNDESRTPSPPAVKDASRSASPRRLRPRKAHERTSTHENQYEKNTDVSNNNTSSKTRESTRHRSEPTPTTITNEDTDSQTSATKKLSASASDSSSNEALNPSNSLSDSLNTSTKDENLTTPRTSNVSATAPVSKSFIWKPKISK